MALGEPHGRAGSWAGVLGHVLKRLRAAEVNRRLEVGAVAAGAVAVELRGDRGTVDGIT